MVRSLLAPDETRMGALELARQDIPAVLYGETGTGKEFVARWIHDHSTRCEQPFLPVNLEHMNSGVVESELFGHTKGAFTGADSGCRGRFEAVGRGVLFLDEFTMALNRGIEKLMRVFETGEFFRVGSSTKRMFQGRLLLGMNCHPKTLLDCGLISRDMYYRINKYPLFIPPQRQRREHIMNFVKQFMAEAGNPDLELAPGDEAFLMRHPFQGNVRELKNLVEHAVYTCGSGRTICLERSSRMLDHVYGGESLPIDYRFLSENNNSTVGFWNAFAQSKLSMKEYFERSEAALIEQALKQFNNSISLSARNLGMSESTLRSKMKKLKIYIR